MLRKEKKLIITFFTTAEAMATEKVCKESKIDGRLISAPRELTADCGISYAVSPSYKLQILDLLNEKKIEYDKAIEIEV